jgi:hypothetical protein
MDQVSVEFQPKGGLWNQPMIRFYSAHRGYLSAILTVRKAKVLRRILDDFIALRAPTPEPDDAKEENDHGD